MHEIKRTNEIDIESYIRNSKDIIIMVMSSYSQEDRLGTYTCLMLYQGYKKIITNVLQDMSSANLTTLLGVLEAVKHINLTNVNVCIISYIALGFQDVKKGNGLYVNDVTAILKEIVSQGNTLSSLVVPDGKEIIKRIIMENNKDWAQPNQ